MTPRRRPRSSVVLTLPIVALMSSRCMAAPPDMGDVFNNAALRGARIGALVVRANDGGVVYARDPDALLAPASNQKILTALAALLAYGPSHRFTTQVLADRPPDDEGHVATLWIRGGGDPALTSEEWWRLSADLRRGGLRRIDGDIMVDDSAFDDQRWNANWGAASARAYYPAIGALMANFGSFGIETRPGHHVGDPLRVALDPPLSYFDPDVQGKTASAETANSVAIERVANDRGERVVVSGTLPITADRELVYRSVAEPASYAGRVLRMQLEANGIDVGGAVRRGAIPERATELLAFSGKPLSEIVYLLMKYSNNAIAETLCKGLGKGVPAQSEPGSWRIGIETMRRLLISAGVDVSSFTLLDGSGLSPGNRVSPRGLVTALRVARASFAAGPELLAALPITAVDGTLQHRGTDVAGRVRAKTGLIDGASGLSGLAHLDDGSDAIFSVLINNDKGADAGAIAAIDRFVSALVHSRADSPRAPAER